MLIFRLIFLHPYSPDLNPIEFILKSVKRVVPIAIMDSEDNLKERIKESFLIVIIQANICKYMGREIPRCEYSSLGK